MLIIAAPPKGRRGTWLYTAWEGTSTTSLSAMLLCVHATRNHAPQHCTPTNASHALTASSADQEALKVNDNACERDACIGGEVS